MNQQQLNRMIEAYFDAALSRADEDRLRRELRRPDIVPTPQVTEARAVMGIAAVLRGRGADRRRKALPILSTVVRYAVPAAACAAIVWAYFAAPAAVPDTYRALGIYASADRSSAVETSFAMAADMLSTASGDAADIVQFNIDNLDL